MKFGPVSLAQAEGAILAHALRLSDGRRLAKGMVLGAGEIARIAADGIASVVVARIEADDLGEDEAAVRIAGPMAGETVQAAAPATGRVNLYAAVNGLFIADRPAVDAVNSVDPGITLATLDSMKEVAAGRMVATVKIIPYAVPAATVARAAEAAANAVRVLPYTARRIGVVATRLPSLKPSAMDKTIRILEGRLQLSGSTIAGEVRVDHDEAAIAAGLGELADRSDILIVFGASAISDIDDVIPCAIRGLGGHVERFGMPVDPGNLLLIGDLAGKPVLGAPGCARSPAENGFDWVLQRLLAGRRVTSAEIGGMGVGGLLMEIGVRPQPRDPRPTAPLRVAAIVLAAGRGTRMEGLNKMTASFEGRPMVAHAIAAATGSQAAETIVVTGHLPGEVEAAAEGQPVRIVHNPDHADGLSTSLAAGIRAVGPDMDAAIVLLGDMPRITSVMVDAMIGTANTAPEGTIVMASHEGRRGNPVLWPRRHFGELSRIAGDVGARGLIAEHGATVSAVEIGPAASFDVDTRQVLEGGGGVVPA